MKRVQFCGVIQGSVVQRPGETEKEAIMRADTTLNILMLNHAKRLSDYGEGPVISLEPNDNA